MLFIPIKNYESEKLKKDIKRVSKIKMTKQTYDKSIKAGTIKKSDTRIIIIDHIDNDVYIVL